MRQSNVFRRRQIDKARSRGESFVVKAIEPVLQLRFKSLTRDLRKGNLRHRLKKNDGVLHKADEIPETWSKWEKQFRETLQNSTFNGAGYLWTAEQKYFASYGYDPFRIETGAVISEYMQRGKTRITDIGSDTEIKVNRVIADWYNTDAGLPDLIRQLSPWFSPQRAALIAATEMAYVASVVSRNQMKQYGIKEWIWDAFNDAITCELCFDLMAQSKQKPFTLDDPMPPDPSHPRCRCGMYYVDVDVQI